MKNKNQKKLKNKKYRWGAYGRTTVGGPGCTPSFSAFCSVSAGPKMLNFSCFSESRCTFATGKRNKKTSKTMYTVAQCQTAIENAKALLQDVINTAHTRDEYTQRRMVDIFTRMLKTAEYNLTIAIN